MPKERINRPAAWPGNSLSVDNAPDWVYSAFTGARGQTPPPIPARHDGIEARGRGRGFPARKEVSMEEWTKFNQEKPPAPGWYFIAYTSPRGFKICTVDFYNDNFGAFVNHKEVEYWRPWFEHPEIDTCEHKMSGHDRVVDLGEGYRFIWCPKCGKHSFRKLYR